MDSSSIDALIAQGYNRVQAIKLHYQNNLKREQAPKPLSENAAPSPQPFVRDAMERINSQLHPSIDPLNSAQPRREFGSNPNDFESDAARAAATDAHVVKNQNAEVERKVAQLRAMRDAQQREAQDRLAAQQRAPLNLRPLAALHGKGTYNEEDEAAVPTQPDDLEVTINPQHSPVPPEKAEKSPVTTSSPSPRQSISGGASTPSESEQFIANLMSQGYKRDEAFLMYLRKVNAEKNGKAGSSFGNLNQAVNGSSNNLHNGAANGSSSNLHASAHAGSTGELEASGNRNSRRSSRTGAELSMAASYATSSSTVDSFNVTSASQEKHVFLDTTRPADKTQEKNFYKFIGGAMSQESVDDSEGGISVGGLAQAKTRTFSHSGPAAQPENQYQPHLSRSQDEAHQAQLKAMQEQQQKLMEQLEAQKEMARQLAEEQQAKLRQQQEEYERTKAAEAQDQKRLVEQLEQQRLQQEAQQQRIVAQQEEQKRLLEEQQQAWLAQQRQLQENLLLQQQQFQEAQAEKLREQERKLAEQQLLLQRQHEEKLLEQKNEQARMLEEIQVAKRLEAQMEARERQKQSEQLEQKRVIDQLEQQRLQQEAQQALLLKQQEEQKRAMEEQQQAWIEQQRRLQDKLLEQQMQFQQQQAEMQAEQARKLEEHKAFLQKQHQEKLEEQAREAARLAAEIEAVKTAEAEMERRRLQMEKKIMEEQLEQQRILQEKHAAALEEQARKLAEKQEAILARQLEEQERQRQELAEQKLLDKQQYQLQQQVLLNQQQQQLQQQTHHQQYLAEQKALLEQQQAAQENAMLMQQKQTFQMQEQQMKMEMQQFENQTRLMEKEASLTLQAQQAQQQLAATTLAATRSRPSLLQHQYSDITEDEDERPSSARNGGDKLAQLRKNRAQHGLEVDTEDDNAAYLNGGGKHSKPPMYGQASPSRSFGKEDSPFGGNYAANSHSKSSHGLLPQRGERLSMGGGDDDDDMSTLSSTSNMPQQSTPQAKRRTSGGYEIFELEEEQEIEGYMRRGHTREMAIHMFKQSNERTPVQGGRPGHRRENSFTVSVSEKDKQRRKSQYTIDQRSDNDPSANPDHEALKMGLLLSQQEAEYGINMYDSLIPADDPLIEEYLKMGLTMDEAVLKIFEFKFGKVATLIMDEPSPVPKARRNSLPPQSSPPPARTHTEDSLSHNPNAASFYTSPSASSNSSYRQGGSPTSSSRPMRPPIAPTSNHDYYQPPPPPPPMRRDSDSMSVSSYGSNYRQPTPPMQQMEYPYPAPRLLTPAQASVDDRALEIAMLISQQESRFGVNMYEDLSPYDEAEIRKLCGRGYSQEDATLAVFERKHGSLQAPPPAPAPSMYGNPQAGVGYGSSPTNRILTPVRSNSITGDMRMAPPPPEYGGMHRSVSSYGADPRSPYGAPPSYGAPGGDYRGGGGSSSSDYHPPMPPQRAGSMIMPPRNPNDGYYGGGEPQQQRNLPHTNSEEEVRNAMRQSQQDVRSRPGVERVAGFASGGGGGGSVTSAPAARPGSIRMAPSDVNIRESDVQQLMSMGFTRDQSVHSLQQNNNNLEVALDRLLTGH